MNRLQPHKRRKWLRWLNIVLVVYLLCGIAFYLLQDRFLFHPVALKRSSPYHFSASSREINVAVDKQSNMNIVQFLTRDSLPRGVVLYFHGNRKNIGWYAAYAPGFTSKGYEVWMIDYPGFGKSTGRLTEQKLYDDALQLYVMARSKFPANSITVYGKSLGTGIASWLAAKRSCNQLILETPYYSMTSLVQHYLPIYPVSTLLKYKLPVYKYISLVNAPVTVFHGTDDKVIPYSNAHRLKEAMHTKDRFIAIKNAGHNNLKDYPRFQNTLDSLLK
ncbi:alpha/beta fold hydrolase [Agriterribacter sp.]|uniref:alpha/beta hydrolase n=1 Tax=Agriterribacter sp. TaxID=2821509 RepID=UPI002D1B6F2C|nr:alpha/beta fold hydrolase [Agriterribacter sp.]HRP58469.1 alpha/beta fold hydrolase [Agriterribacter sp.]